MFIFTNFVTQTNIKQMRISAFTTKLHNLRDLQRRGFDVKKSLPPKKSDVACINCGQQFDGAFCPLCGQPASTARFTMRDALHNIFATVLAGDSVFFRTCRDLLWRPGYLASDYLQGKRVRYFRPVQLLVRIVAVFVIASFLLGKGGELFTTTGETILHENVHSTLLTKAITYLSALFTNKVYSALLMVVFYVLPFKFVFRKFRLSRIDGTTISLNVAEHFHVLVYQACLQMIISLLLLCSNSIGIAFFNNELTEIVLTILLPMWIYRQLYDIAWWRSMLLCIGAITLTLLFVSIFVILSFGIFYGIEAVA